MALSPNLSLSLITPFDHYRCTSYETIVNTLDFVIEFAEVYTASPFYTDHNIRCLGAIYIKNTCAIKITHFLVRPFNLTI